MHADNVYYQCPKAKAGTVARAVRHISLWDTHLNQSPSHLPYCTLRAIQAVERVATHALKEIAIVQPFSKCSTGELPPAIRMDDQIFRRFPQGDSLIESVDRKLRVNFAAHRPADKARAGRRLSICKPHKERICC